MDSVELKATAVLIVSSIVALLAVYAWYHFTRQRRLVQDVPTSKVAGVSLGLTELVGIVTTPEPTVSPHGQKECAFWRQEHYIEVSDGDDGKRWKLEDERTGGRRYFDLRDDSGFIRVWTRDADLQMPLVYEGTPYERPTPATEGLDLVAARAGAVGPRRKVKEYALDVGADVYVLGNAFLSDQSTRPEIASDPGGDEPFIVSTRGESALMREHRIAAMIAAIVAVAGAIAAGIAWSDGVGIAAGTTEWSAVSWASAIACIVLVGWIMAMLGAVIAYNGLIRLRNRAVKSWSLLDVELARRHTLLPRLIRTVRAQRQHEADLHHRVAALRAGWVDDLPDKPSDDAVGELDQPLELETRAVRDLLAQVEAYPELKVNEAFLQLQRQLAETETRIALARSFYNDSVERLRERTETFPDSLLAWVFDLRLGATFTEYWDERVAIPAQAGRSHAV
ncbi:MAG: LemA family protein [Acidimicrobiia bacterium]|nr:LemA family protein [Acidimicrobiia bacterium]